MTEWAATTYLFYSWDCPACGEVNGCGGIEPSGDGECKGCGVTVSLT